MRLDLTENIKLTEKDYKLYSVLQALLYLFAIIIAGFFAFNIFFPQASFYFSFNSIVGKKNTLINPQDESFVPIKRGDISANNKFSFYAPLSGNFSKAIVNFTLDKNSDEINTGSIKVQKSYAAFLYPTGAPIGFKNGALLKNTNDYYIVSNGELRKFTTPAIFSSLGFPQDAFIEVSQDDLHYNSLGQQITTVSGYPDNSIFKINDTFYILQNQMLYEFASDAAYLSQYSPNQAIEKDAAFLDYYTLSEDIIGFADGSLISYGNSIFIVSGNFIFPIDSPITFAQKGYDWDNVIRAGADEIALYKKTRIFTIASPHPAGTFFTTAEDKKYYVIQDNQKHLLPSENIANSWQKRNSIIVSEKSLNITANCLLQIDALSMRSYSCEIPIGNLQTLSGTDYEFSAEINNPIKLDSISVVFKKSLNTNNLRTTISEIFNGIRKNYAR